MVKDNIADFVRNKIDALVDAQESSNVNNIESNEKNGIKPIAWSAYDDRQKIVSTEMDEKRSNKKKNLFAILTSVLSVVIVGVIVAVAVIKMNEEYVPEIPEEIKELASGSEIGSEIVSKFAWNQDYSYEDAVSDFEKEMNAGGEERRIYIAIAYALFVYDQKGNADDAANILLALEEEIQNKNDNVKLDYYITLRNIYKNDCSGEKYEYYDNLVTEYLDDEEKAEIIIEEPEE